jgi:hypothetical protein
MTVSSAGPTGVNACGRAKPGRSLADSGRSEAPGFPAEEGRVCSGIDELVGIIHERNRAIRDRQWRAFETSYRRQVLRAELDAESALPDRRVALRRRRGEFLDEVVPPHLRAPGAVEPPLPKIVFLLGAGTSASAGVPLASKVVEDCLTAIGETTLRAEIQRMRADFAESHRGETEAAWSRYLLSADGVGELSFEEVLSAYRRLVGERELLELMRNRFRVAESEHERGLITLFNECLAHLCREQLVDFIVSLNFDELLETSLDEDIGRDGYVRIIEEARFKWAGQYGLVAGDGVYADPMQRRARAGCERARPWLLKPHGTISHETTLCHVPERVYRLGADKEAVLEQVLADAHLVVVGYGLTALDLHPILMSHALTGSIRKLLWVDPTAKPGPMGAKLREVLDRGRSRDERRFVHVQMDADDFAMDLFRRLYVGPDAGRPESPARGGAPEEPVEAREATEVAEAGMLPPYRHFLRAVVFGRGAVRRPGVACSFEHRLVVECIAFAVRMKGWWSSRALAKSHQIQHLWRNATQEQQDQFSNLPELLAPYFVSFPRVGRSERIYVLRRRLGARGHGQPAGDGRQSTAEHEEFVRRIQLCLPGWCDAATEAGPAGVARTMGGLMRWHADVALYEEPDELGTIRHAVPIHATPVLRGLTAWLLDRNEGIYVVSETGKYLRPPAPGSPGGRPLGPRLAGILLGDYPALEREIEGRLGRSGEESVYVQDIHESANLVRSLLTAAGPWPGGVCQTVDTFRKRYHFTLWHDPGNERVAGIVYTRIDRQPGATFHWIELDLRNEGDRSQFDAWRTYMCGEERDDGGPVLRRGRA